MDQQTKEWVERLREMKRVAWLKRKGRVDISLFDEGHERDTVESIMREMYYAGFHDGIRSGHQLREEIQWSRKYR